MLETANAICTALGTGLCHTRIVQRASVTDNFFTQDDLSLRITGLPATAPDEPATVIAIECEGEPTMSHEYVRKPGRASKSG